VKHYPNPYALLTQELGTQCPPLDRIEAMVAKIEAEYPSASHLVYFSNGHWILLPAGPGCKFTKPQDASRANIPYNRRARAYCPIK
jgi:hypothetical protein